MLLTYFNTLAVSQSLVYALRSAYLKCECITAARRRLSQCRVCRFRSAHLKCDCVTASRRKLSQFRMRTPKTAFQGQLRHRGATKAAVIRKRLQMRPPFPRKMKCTSDGHFAPYHIPESLALRWRWNLYSKNTAGESSVGNSHWNVSSLLCFHLLKYLVKVLKARVYFLHKAHKQ